MAQIMNKRLSGKPALNSPDSNGYLSGNLNGESARASRIIWKLVTGEDPDREVEHRNRVRTDNRWTNLRLATHAQNCLNKDVLACNTSGIVGVHYSRNELKWKAYITVARKRVHLGTFASKQEASAARSAAQQRHHGEFASCA